MVVAKNACKTLLKENTGFDYRKTDCAEVAIAVKNIGTNE